MSIVTPTPVLSESDKRLISLMSKLLIDQTYRADGRSNVSGNAIILTDSEANELLQRIENLVASHQFIEASYFVEGLTVPEESEKSNLREIYLSARQRRGRTRALASTHWAEFQVRLGIGQATLWGINARPMSMSYFQKMERKLLSTAGLHPRVVDLVMHVIELQSKAIEDIRHSRRSLSRGAIKQAVFESFLKLRDQFSHIRDPQISSARIAAAITIVSDISILFTTRDWSVTGTLSTIAGASTQVMSE